MAHENGRHRGRVSIRGYLMDLFGGSRVFRALARARTLVFQNIPPCVLTFLLQSILQRFFLYNPVFSSSRRWELDFLAALQQHIYECVYPFVSNIWLYIFWHTFATYIHLLFSMLLSATMCVCKSSCTSPKYCVSLLCQVCGSRIIHQSVSLSQETD